MFAKLKNAKADITTMNLLLPEAERIARSQGATEPGAEHLVAAAISLPDGIAAHILGDRGIDRDRWLQAVADQHATALQSVGIDGSAVGVATDAMPARGPLRSQESMRDLFGHAVARAKAARRPLHSGDVLAVALDLEHGTVPRTVDHLGLSRSALVAELTQR